MATTLHSADAHLTASARLAAMLSGAAVVALTGQRSFLRIAGPDAARWLNGMVTNNLQSLLPGEGNYNFLLNAQGRILGDCTIYREPVAGQPAFRLETDTAQIETIHQHLDKFIIMDDVELSDVTESRNGLLLAGPRAVSILQCLTLPVGQFATLRLQPTLWNAAPLDILHTYSPLLPRIELWSDPATIQRLAAAIREAGASAVSPEAFEQLRVIEGTPRYGTDIRNSEAAHDLPQETSPIGVQSRALHFAKGCYLGQEIVERIRSRGNVHRSFSGFALTGSLPEPGTVLAAESKPAGELTSVASIHVPKAGPETSSIAERTASSPVQIALGYVRREALDRNLILTYPGGSATPIALPYPIPRAII